jgi:predicted ATP-grasp superfamily ATP-dependent carboligase
LDVLILDGATRQALTVTRALGGADLRVGVAAERRSVAPAAASRWCSSLIELPPVGGDRAIYVDAVLSALQVTAAEVLLPCYDGSIEAVRSRRTEVEQHARVALAKESALEMASDKDKTLNLARELGIRTPRSAHIGSVDELPGALADVGTPAVLKPRRSWIGDEHAGVRACSRAVVDLSDARKNCQELMSSGATVTVQEWLPGRRDAVTTFVVEGDVKVCFAQMSHRELPRLGGVSVLCESIAPRDDIVKPAQRLVVEMELEGCSIVEFRRDADGSPVLMEINPRLAGSMELARRCGVDLANMTYRWATGRPVEAVERYAVGRRLRWFVGELWTLHSALHGDTGPDVPSRRRATYDFIRTGFQRNSPAMFAVADPVPAWVEFRSLVLQPALARFTGGTSNV